MPQLYPGLDSLTYNVGGGQIQAEQALAALQASQQAELSRQQVGQGLLGYLTDIQRDPFSIVPAMRAYGATGGGTLGGAAALAASGGRGQPSPYGQVAGNLIRSLSEFSGGTEINPYTGAPFTPMELGQARTTGYRASQMNPAQRSQYEADIGRLHQTYVQGRAYPELISQLAPQGPISPFGGGNPALARLAPVSQVAGVAQAPRGRSLLGSNLKGVSRSMRTLRSVQRPR